MRVVIQRVLHSKVTINDNIQRKIGHGLLIFVGINELDNEIDIEWVTRKILQLRIFNDEFGVMNKNINDVNGEIMVISQFTLYASTKKGNRPSYSNAAKPEKAIPIYEYFVKYFERIFTKKIETGEFGANMRIELLNDGPVTIIIDSKNKE